MSVLEREQHCFVARAKECKQLGKLFNQSLECGTRMVLLGGDTGIGKTSLLEKLKGNVRVRGGHYLVCKGGPLGSSFPYHPLAELLRVVINDVGENRVKEVIGYYSPRILTELSVLVPRFATLFSNALRGQSYSGRLADKLFIENACSIVRELLRKTPVVLVIEDIPYADPTTLQVLQYFLQNPEDVRMLICGTYNLDDIDLSGKKFLPFQSFVRALNAQENLSKISLDPFTCEEAEEYLSNLLDAKILPDGLADMVCDKSEGNPLIIKHLIDEMIATGHLQHIDKFWTFTRPMELSLPEEVAEMFLSRLEGLNPELKDALAVAAVIGRKFRADTLAFLLKTSLVDLLPLLEKAIKLKLIEEHRDLGGYNFTFVSSRFQEVLYESLTFQRKSLLHEQIGINLEQTSNPALHPEDFAYHFQWGSDKTKAAEYAVMAGQRALTLYAFHSAWRHFHLARELFPSLNEKWLDCNAELVLEGLAESASYLGYYNEAWDSLGMILERGIDEQSHTYSSVQNKLGQLCYRMGNYVESIEHYKLAIDKGLRENKCVALNRMLQTYIQMGKFTEAEYLVGLQLDWAGRIGGVEILQEVYNLAAQLYLAKGEIIKAKEYADLLLGEYELNDYARLNNILVLSQLALESQGSLIATNFLTEGLKLARKTHDPLIMGQVQLLFAYLYVLQGQYSQALDKVNMVKSLEVYEHSFVLKANAVLVEAITSLTIEGFCYIGNLPDEIKSVWHGREESVYGVSALCYRAQLEIKKDCVDECTVLLQQAVAIRVHFPTIRNHVHFLRARASSERLVGNDKSSSALIAECLDICRKNGLLSEALITMKICPGCADEDFEQAVNNNYGLAKKMEKHLSSKQVSAASMLPREVNLALEYIHAEYSGAISIADLCKIVSMSERQLRRLFTQFTGGSIKEYISSYRIEKAKQLLCNPTFAVGQVGDSVGLSDKSHFCKTFKALVGITPSEFRKSQSSNVRNNQHQAQESTDLT